MCTALCIKITYINDRYKSLDTCNQVWACIYYQLGKVELGTGGQTTSLGESLSSGQTWKVQEYFQDREQKLIHGDLILRVLLSLCRCMIFLKNL